MSNEQLLDTQRECRRRLRAQMAELQQRDPQLTEDGAYAAALPRMKSTCDIWQACYTVLNYRNIRSLRLR